ncbi:MAG: hypothetical protein IKL76_01050 [Clostridia bacterium]|nr:hypothetical protein [Clostridia bacterium]
MSDALGVIATAESESVKEDLLKRLRDKTNITYHSLERDLRAKEKEKPKEEKQETLEQTRIAETAGADKSVKAIRFILASKLFSTPYAKAFDLSELAFENEEHRLIAEYIVEREKAGERIRPSALFEIFSEDSEELNAILNLNYEDKLSGEIASRFFSDSVRALQREAIEREIAKYNREYAQITDEDERKATTQKIAQAVQRRKQLKK